MISAVDNNSRIVAWLGYGGLIPFVLGCAGFYSLEEATPGFFASAFITYAAVILSFIGAVHWGVVLTSESIISPRRLLCIAVLPALVGWLATLLPFRESVVLLIIAFTAFYIHERLSELAGCLPDWYLPMRTRLTTAVLILHGILLIGLW